VKIDLNEVIRDLRLKAIPTMDENESGKESATRDLTLRDVCITALTMEKMTVTPDGRLFPAENPDGKEKFLRFQLANRIFGIKEPVIFSAEEIVMLKNRIAAIYGPVIMGRAWDLLDPKEPEK